MKKWVSVVLLLLFAVGGAVQAQSEERVLTPNVEVAGVLHDVAGHAHPFWIPAGTGIRLTLKSADFDAYLVLLDGAGHIVAQGAGEVPGGDARLAVTAQSGGWYRAVALAAAGRGVGAYSLLLTVEDALSEASTDLPLTASPATRPAPPPADALPLNRGEWTTGELQAEAGLPPGGTGPRQVYTFWGTAGEAVWIRLLGDAMDPYLWITDAQGRVIAEDDDSYGWFDSQIVMLLPADGWYLVHAGSLWGGWVGDTFQVRVDTLDSLQTQRGYIDGSGGWMQVSSYEQEWEPAADQVLFAWLRSQDFDAYLSLFDASGTFLVADDDSGGGLDAFIVYAPEYAGRYTLSAEAWSADQSGAFELLYWSVPEAVAAGPDGLLPIQEDVWSGAGSVEVIPLVPGDLVLGALDPEYHEAFYNVRFDDGTEAADVWVFAEEDIDLEVWSVGPAPQLIGEVFGPTGYEHLRVQLDSEVPEIEIGLTGWLVTGAAPFYILAEPATGDTPFPHAWYDRHPAHGAATGPLAGRLVPGERRTGLMNPETERTQTWVVDVPSDVGSMHVRLYGATGDFDLSVAPWRPAPFGEMHPWASFSLRHNESLHVSAEPGENLEPGVYAVAVWSSMIDTPSRYEIEVAFDVTLPPPSTFTLRTEEELAAMQPQRRARLATVEVTSWYASGSGSMVSPNGLILTNYHVIAPCVSLKVSPWGCDDGSDPWEIEPEYAEIVIGLTDEMRGHAVQAFIAEVVDVAPRYDLALLQIVSDLDGKAAPATPLPFFAIDARHSGAELGEDVLAIGYPEVARLGARTPITLTRGIVSGFTEWEGERVFVQMDASVAGGNSGGALIRSEDAALIGVPSDRMVFTDRFEAQGFARPVSLLPPEWRALLKSNGAVFLGE